MTPALLLVDLQEDYLSATGLRPPREALVEGAGRLLQGCRRLGLPVLHCWTTIRSDADRMPHWRRDGKWACVEGTAGHAPPGELEPLKGEAVFHKRYFDPFAAPGLEQALRTADPGPLILAGVHLHACVRAAALGGYERGLKVWIAEDAVGSDEPAHARETRRWLDGRAAAFLSVKQVLERVGSAHADLARA